MRATHNLQKDNQEKRPAKFKSKHRPGRVHNKNKYCFIYDWSVGGGREQQWTRVVFSLCILLKSWCGRAFWLLLFFWCESSCFFSHLTLRATAQWSLAIIGCSLLRSARGHICPAQTKQPSWCGIRTRTQRVDIQSTDQRQTLTLKSSPLRDSL